MENQALVLEVMYQYKGKKMSYAEVLKSLGVADAGPEHQQKIFSKYVQKGAIREIKDTSPDAKMAESVAGELIVEAQLSLVQQDSEAKLKYDRERRIEGKGLIVEDQLSFFVPTRLQSQKVMEFLSNRGIEYDASQSIKPEDGGRFLFTMYQVTREDEKALDRYLKGQDIAVSVKNMGNKAADSIGSLLSGVVSISGGVIAGATKVTAKTVGQTAASIMKVGAEAVVTTKETFTEQAREMAHDEKVLKAKLELSSLVDAAKRKLGGGGNRSSRFF